VVPTGLTASVLPGDAAFSGGKQPAFENGGGAPVVRPLRPMSALTGGKKSPWSRRTTPGHCESAADAVPAGRHSGGHYGAESCAGDRTIDKAMQLGCG